MRSLNLPVASDQPYGYYTITLNNTVEYVKRMFTVLDLDGFGLASMPYTRVHNMVEYSFYPNRTLIASGFKDEIVLRLPDLPFDYSITPYNNSMMFVARFIKGSQIIDFSFAFIHSGLKIIVNGTRDQSGTFTFQFNPIKVKNYLHRIQTGNLVFDYSDMAKAMQSFTYNKTSGELSVNIPQSFRIDPTIFEDGFESNDYSAWTNTHTSNGILATTSALAYEGTYSSNSTLTGSGTAYAISVKAFTTSNPIHHRYYIRFQSFPASGATNTISNIGTQSGGYYWFLETAITNTAGVMNWTLCYRNDAWPTTWTAVHANSGPSLDTWYLIETRYLQDPGGGSGEAIVYVDETPVISITNNDLNDASIRVAQGFSYDDCGSTGGNAPAKMVTDSHIIDDEYIGPVSGVTTFTRILNATFNYEDSLDRQVDYQREQDETFNIEASLSRQPITYTRILSETYNMVTTLIQEGLALTLWFYDGVSSVSVNGTSISNGTSTSIPASQIARILANITGGYQFSRYQYDSTHIHDNPYDHTMTSSITIHGYAIRDITGTGLIVLLAIIALPIGLIIIVKKTKRNK